MANFERIQKDCFWDLDITLDELKNIPLSDEMIKKKLLFEKILLNSTSLFQDLQIFDQDQLLILLDNYKIPNFNKEYAFRRKNMAEVYFFDKPLLIDELKWVS